MKLPILFLLLIIPLSTPAQITTDGSLGPQLNLPGPDYQIRPNLGQQRGGNLSIAFKTLTCKAWKVPRFQDQITFKM